MITDNNYLKHDGHYYRLISYDMNNKLKREITFLEKLGNIEKFKDNIPEDLTYNTPTSAYMKEYPQGTLDKTFFQVSCDEQIKLLKKILALWNKFNTITPHQYEDNLPDAKKVYIDKYWKYFTKKNLDIYTKPTWYINNKEYLDLYSPNILDFIYNKLLHISDTCIPRIMHGDFTLSNMIYDNSHIRLIDPRGSFGNGWSLYGDTRLDLAKLRMSLDDYELFDQHKMVYHFKGNKLNYSFNIDLKESLQFLDEFIIKKYDLCEIKLLEACSFINLIPSYTGEEKQLLYCKAVEIINNIL